MQAIWARAVETYSRNRKHSLEDRAMAAGISRVKLKLFKTTKYHDFGFLRDRQQVEPCCTVITFGGYGERRKKICINWINSPVATFLDNLKIPSCNPQTATSMNY
ncbi:MAG: hypothetical protein ABI169_09250 [Chitinophagaceae bacterium]